MTKWVVCYNESALFTRELFEEHDLNMNTAWRSILELLCLMLEVNYIVHPVDPPFSGLPSAK